MKYFTGTNEIYDHVFLNCPPPFDAPEAIVVGFSLMVKFVLCKEVFGVVNIGVNSRD